MPNAAPLTVSFPFDAYAARSIRQLRGIESLYSKGNRMKKLAALLILSLGACTGSIQTSPGPSGPPPAGPPPGPPPARRPPPQEPPPVVVQPQPPPPAEERWTELAPPQLNKDYRDLVKVGADAGRFRRLRLDVTRGRVRVIQVGIEFLDGSTQKVQLGREIGAGESMDINLDGRERGINRIIVFVDPAQGRRDRGVYRLYGR